jgi:RNA polymerase sigma factor (TIGR02999 family)
MTAAELLPLVYQELRHLARRTMAKERVGHTLQPTALVHEAYIRLVQGQEVAWQNRVHFFRAASQAMRWILVDAARRKATYKHGGGQRTPLSDVDQIADQTPSDALLALDEALDRLERLDPRKADVVKLRYFAGLSVDETAAALGVTSRTVRRDWVAAKTWLWRDITRTDTPTNED